MKKLVMTSLTIASTLCLGAVQAQDAAQKRFQLGIMKCQSVPGTKESKIVSSRVQVDCQMNYAGGMKEAYTGETGVKAGIDLSSNRKTTLIFSVISSAQLEPVAGMMAGEFQGAKAAVTAGVGAGANALGGGVGNKLTLSPMAPEGSTGLGVAVGMAYLKLQPVEE